jgi:hypothetical protein
MLRLGVVREVASDLVLAVQEDDFCCQVFRRRPLLVNGISFSEN